VLEASDEDALPGLEMQTESVSALNEFADRLDTLITVGEEYADDWHAILHDGYLPFEGVMAYKREWLAWGKASMSVAPLLKYSDQDFLQMAMFATREEVEI